MLEAHVNRGSYVLTSTVWQNAPAMECQLAAMVLTLRGPNVDRALWTMGPGGVRQSLNTALVANVYGALHSYVDRNIYYSDAEFHK